MNSTLVSSGIGGRLVLEAVPRADLVDPDAISHGRSGRRSWRRVRRAAGPSPVRCGRRGSRCARSRTTASARALALVGAASRRFGAPHGAAPCSDARSSGSGRLSLLRSRRERTATARRRRARPRRATWSPARAASSATVPAIGATTACSIFIASRVAIGSPASTVLAGPTWTARIEPGIGATTSIGPPPWRPPAAARAARSTSGAAASRNGDAPAGDVDVGDARRRRRAAIRCGPPPASASS